MQPGTKERPGWWGKVAGSRHGGGVGKAKTNPANSIVAKATAGCSPVLSPMGDRAYVSARGDNALLLFDTAKLLSDPENSRLASVTVGEAPVGIAVIDQGRKIVVANSDRFSSNKKNQYLSVIAGRRTQNVLSSAQSRPASFRASFA